MFSKIVLEVADRARIGIVGPNGGGKTSLLRVLVGELEPDGGTVVPSQGLRVGYVPQTTQRNVEGTLKDEVMSAFSRLRRLEDALAASGLEIQRAEHGQRRQAERRYSGLLQQYARPRAATTTRTGWSASSPVSASPARHSPDAGPPGERWRAHSRGPHPGAAARTGPAGPG